MVAPLLLACRCLLLAAAVGDHDDYCDAVEEHQEELAEILGERRARRADRGARRSSGSSQDKAPDDIPTSGRTSSAARRLEDALEDAGVDPATYDRDDPPAGLTDEEKDRDRRRGQELAAPRRRARSQDVEQQARDVCKTPLTL